MMDFNRPDIVLIDTENKTALAIDTAVPLTHNFPKTEAEKITKYETLPWKLKMPVILTTYLYTVYPLVISAKGVVTKNFLKYLENVRLTKYVLRVEQKALLLQTCRIVSKFIGHAP
jgi:hypothetical protein